jgi:hypothetical protein
MIPIRLPAVAITMLIPAMALLVGCGGGTPPARSYAAPDAFRASLAKVYEAYLIVANALADGQEVLSANAASAMHSRLHEVPPEGLDSAAKAYWDTTTNRIMAVLHSPAGTDIASGRRLFAGYSPILADAFRAFDLGSRVPIVAFTCPTAVDGGAAMWMQRESIPANPYLGRADNSCADPVK